MKHLKINLNKRTYTGHSKAEVLAKMVRDVNSRPVIGSVRVSGGTVSFDGQTKGDGDSKNLLMYHASKVNAHRVAVKGGTRSIPTTWKLVVTVIPFGLLQFLPAGTKFKQHTRHWSIETPKA